MPKKNKVITDIGYHHQVIQKYLIEETDQEDSLILDPDKLIEYLGYNLKEFDFNKEFKNQLFKEKTKLRALLDYQEKIIAVHSTLSDQQKRFSKFHEIAHAVLPDHINKFWICSADDMKYRSDFTFEVEANRFAADLLFNNKKFYDIITNKKLESETIVDIADIFNASYESSARRFVEKHVLPCALIVYTRNNINDDSKHPWKQEYIATSRIFSIKYFSRIYDKNPDEATEASHLTDIRQSLKKNFVINDLKFIGEYFYNQYKVFCLLQPR